MNTLWFKEKFQLETLSDLQQRCDASSVRLLEYKDSPLINLSYRDNSNPNDLFAMCCRGLVLDKNTLAVVARPFSRFFNYRENSQHLLLDFAMSSDDFDCQVLEKVDGSMIKLFCYQGVWYVGTKGSTFGENTLSNTKVKYADLFVWALKNKQLTAEEVDDYTIKYKTLTDEETQENHAFLQSFANDEQLDPSVTYVFELCSPLNQIVIEYPVSLYFLTALYNGQDEFNDHTYCSDLATVFSQDEASIRASLVDMVQRQQLAIAPSPIFQQKTIRYPKHYAFNHVEEVLQASEQLSGIEGEGYVVTINGVPKIKIKSPDFLLRSTQVNSLSPERLFDIVFSFEENEWLANFPQDKDRLMPYVEARETLICQSQTFLIDSVYQFLHIDKKDIHIGTNYQALLTDKSIMKHIYSQAPSKGVASVTANLLRGKTIDEIFAQTTKSNRREWLLQVL